MCWYEYCVTLCISCFNAFCFFFITLCYYIILGHPCMLRVQKPLSITWATDRTLYLFLLSFKNNRKVCKSWGAGEWFWLWLLVDKILKINDHVVITHTTIDAKIGDQFRTSATAIIWWNLPEIANRIRNVSRSLQAASSLVSGYW